MTNATHADVVIVGSGFGGAVMAARLGQALKTSGSKRTVLVLERGMDPSGTLDPSSDGGALNAQGNRFRQSLEPRYLSTVARLYTDSTGAFQAGTPSMSVAAGQGFGGGSNAYDGVSLRAPATSFDQTRDGKRLWPAMYSRAALDPYYATVEARLNVKQLAWTDASAPHSQLATKRDYVFAEACSKIGAAAAPLKLADAGDANEGWWNQGQRFAGRQNLTQNYLADAAAAGVTFASGQDVQGIARGAGGSGYVVSGVDTRGGGSVPFSIECTLLVVASGAVGSSGLLLGAKGGLAPLEDLASLGRYLSSNGDYGVTGTVGASYASAVEGFKGKPMSSFCPTYFSAQQFIIIPFYTPPLYLGIGQPASLVRAASDSFVRGGVGVGTGDDGQTEREFGADYKARLVTFGKSMLTMGCLALDACEGEVVLGKLGTEVRWAETAASTDTRWAAAWTVMQKLYAALGGEIWLDDYRRRGTVNTAHPLGGCRMAEAGDSDGVVDPFGEVAGLPNLFVVDGAIVPSALGVNPSLTIAAVAELIADHVVRGDGTKSLADRLGG